MTVQFVVASTIEAFDEAAFKERLAAQFTGVSVADIVLVVVSGSISVTATISTGSDATRSQNIINLINGQTEAMLSTALGVSVTSKGTAAVTSALATPPSPSVSPATSTVDPIEEPSSSTSALTGGSSSGGVATAVIVGSIVGGVLALVLVVAMVLCMRKRMRPAEEQSMYPGAPTTGVVPLARRPSSKPSTPKTPQSPRNTDFAGLNEVDIQLHSDPADGEATAASEPSDDTVNEIINSNNQVAIDVPPEPARA